jgi:serine phosphatase RsbU (regulator of sigma subunit)/Tfp pilus assembly protein PilF
MKHIICLFLLLISFNGEAQDIDSLKLELKNATHDTTRCQLLNAMVEAEYDAELWPIYNEQLRVLAEKHSKKNTPNKRFYLKHLADALNNTGYLYNSQGDLHKALPYYHKSLKIYEEIAYKKGIATGFNNIGTIYKKQGDLPKALAYFDKSLKIDEDIGNQAGIASGFNNIGAIYKDQGDIPKALAYFHKSLKIQEEIGNQRGIATGINNIGIIYKRQGDVSSALTYYHQSLKIREEIGDKNGIATSLNNIGGIYKSQGDVSSALTYFHQSLKIREEIGEKSGIANSLNNIGGIYDEQGDLSNALAYYHQSLKIREEIGYIKGIAISFNSIGSIELKKGSHLGTVAAKEYFLKALKIAQEIGFPALISTASSRLSTVYEKQGEGMLALSMHQLHVQMRDSINNETTLKASIQQEAKYTYEKVQAVKDAAHEKQLAIEKEAKAKQQVITTATGVGLALVGLFLLFVMNRLKVTRKQKEVIEQQKEVVEVAHQEIKDSITYAKRIQSAILPPAKLVKAYLKESFILYQPKDVVAGDFYWLEHKEDKVLFAAADCTGHGVPGAMVSVVCNNALNRSVREHGLTDPGEILNKTRAIVVAEFEKSEEEVKDGMDIALCSLAGNQLKYAGAHHPLWIIRNGELLETKANKQPIGQFDNPEPYTTHSFDLEPGDAIYIFSDGYVDQFGGEKGKKFKSRAFRELLLSIQDNAMEEQKTIIDETFNSWKGDLEQIDDVCVIGVRIG